MNSTAIPPSFIYYKKSPEELGPQVLRENLQKRNIYSIRHVEEISAGALLAFARDITPAAIATTRWCWNYTQNHDDMKQNWQSTLKIMLCCGTCTYFFNGSTTSIATYSLIGGALTLSRSVILTALVTPLLLSLQLKKPVDYNIFALNFMKAVEKNTSILQANTLQIEILPQLEDEKGQTLVQTLERAYREGNAETIGQAWIPILQGESPPLLQLLKIERFILAQAVQSEEIVLATEIPAEHLCPISKRLMINPIRDDTAEGKQFYERVDIFSHLLEGENGATSPMTRSAWQGSIPSDETKQKEVLDWVISQILDPQV